MLLSLLEGFFNRINFHAAGMRALASDNFSVSPKMKGNIPLAIAMARLRSNAIASQRTPKA